MALPSQDQLHIIQERAADWFTKQDCGEMTAADVVAFEHWLDESPIHRAEYERVVTLWADLNDLVIEAPIDTTVVEFPKQRKTSKMKAVYAIAACLVLAIGMSWQSILNDWKADYTTAIGEVSHVMLQDGTEVYLNTNTALAVNYTESIREVTVLEGQAEFNVAKDAERAFVVKTAHGSARALGTIYDVKKLDDHSRVSVLESKVSVSSLADSAVRVLSSGQRVSFNETSTDLRIEKIDLANLNSWKRNKVFFNHTRLANVIEEINQYHQGVILVLGEELLEMKVSGVFDLRAPVSIVNKLENALDINSIRITDKIIILKK